MPLQSGDGMVESVWMFDSNNNPTHRRCSKCKEFLTLDKFNKKKAKKYGIRPACRVCEGFKNVPSLYLYDENKKVTHKKCSHCDEFVAIGLFYKSRHNKHNVTALCKHCFDIQGKIASKKPIARLKNIYGGMVARCYKKDSRNYKYYGKKGVTICDEWLNSRSSFIEWSIANGYSVYLTIDRIDFTKEYSPSNCRWSTTREQGRNKSNIKLSMKKAEEIRKRLSNGEIGNSMDMEYGVKKGYCTTLGRKTSPSYTSWRTDEWLVSNGYLKQGE